MTLPTYCLLAGGIASLLLALLHIALAIWPKLYCYFGADELSQMHVDGSPFTVLVTIGLVLLFAAWGAYALSGAGLIRQLPLLRAVLITIGVIYVLRSLMLPGELVKVIQSGYPFRFIFFSAASLTFGVLYLYGTLAN